jgi:hypothetical protein
VCSAGWEVCSNSFVGFVSPAENLLSYKALINFADEE